MIVKWIAQALMAGQPHLILNKEQLTQWHTSGCRFTNGSPYNSLGSYALMYLGKTAGALRSTLMELPLYDWPVGVYSDWDPVNRRRGVIPRLEATPAGDGLWVVPFIPKDLGHALNAWSFDLGLGAEEMAALKPMAAALAGRCLLTSYCKTSATHHAQPIYWDDSRLQLALLGGLGLDQLQALYVKGRVMDRATQAVAPLTLAMVQAWSDSEGERS